jgi:hypothetical protein
LLFESIAMPATKLLRISIPQWLPANGNFAL